MSLCNVYEYLNKKTVKLSDSYQVRIKLSDKDFSGSNNPGVSKYSLNITQPDNNEIELYECTSVTLPSYKPKQDIFEYGNNSKTFIYMDPTSLDDLEIEVNEHYGYDVKNQTDILYIDNLVNLFLSKLFDNEKFQYILDDYIPEINVYVFNNNFSKICTKYVFKDLKLTNYAKYNLDYSSTEIAKWTLKFSYRSFYAEVMSTALKEDTVDKPAKENQQEPAESVESPKPTAERRIPGEMETSSPSTEEQRPPTQNIINLTDQDGPDERPESIPTNTEPQFNEPDIEQEPPETATTDAVTEVDTNKKQTEKSKLKQNIVKRNPDAITLTESDIDKYVPFLYKPVARGYFDKYKNENGTLTLVVNEKMIDENVPMVFRSSAKKAYKNYMADHPKQN